MLAAYKLGELGTYHNTEWDAAINAPVRQISARFLIKSAGTVDFNVTANVSEAVISTDTPSKVSPFGVVSTNVDITLIHIDSAEARRILSRLANGWLYLEFTTGDGLYVPEPAFFLADSTYDHVNDTLHLKLFDALGFADRKVMADIDAWQTKGLADAFVWIAQTLGMDYQTMPYILNRYGKTCGDVFTAETNLRTALNSIAEAAGTLVYTRGYWRGTSTSSASKGFLVFLGQTESAVPVDPMAAHDDITGDLVPTGTIDTESGGISIVLQNDNGDTIAEDSSYGNNILKYSTAETTSYILQQLSAFYANGTFVPCAIDSRGNPRVHAGVAVSFEDGAETITRRITSNTLFYNGGMNGRSERDLTGYESAGINNAESTISGVYSQISAIEQRVTENTSSISGMAARLENDTDWVYCYVGDSWQNVDGYPLRARRVGRSVMVNGYLTPVASWANDGYAYVAVVPEWARPTIALTAFVPSNWSDRCTVFLGTDGTIVFYGHTRANGAATPVQNGEHIDINLSYFV